ncbi:hypothetical protein AALP_AA8G025600 [Arabis alpina]|uniref:Secreted protein n=1 Tax=Arabis alpina TaxID=50452 RepID=A0A087G4J1_ARAAL|nr:hypothetical protein AALP_AA8G025600 [Arabis alpina]
MLDPIRIFFLVGEVLSGGLTCVASSTCYGAASIVCGGGGRSSLALRTVRRVEKLRACGLNRPIDPRGPPFLRAVVRTSSLPLKVVFSLSCFAIFSRSIFSIFFTSAMSVEAVAAVSTSGCDAEELLLLLVIALGLMRQIVGA